MAVVSEGAVGDRHRRHLKVRPCAVRRVPSVCLGPYGTVGATAERSVATEVGGK